MDKAQKYNIDDYLKDDKELSKALIEELLQQLSLYTKTLTEIKEYCESQVRVEKKNKYKTNGYIVAFDILQIISEVEE